MLTAAHELTSATTSLESQRRIRGKYPPMMQALNRNWRMLSTAPSPQKKKTPYVPSSVTFVKAGLPFLLFVGGAAYVLSAAIEGKNKERDVAKGSGFTISKSERQYKMEKEKDDMMEKLNTKMKEDFDNTKRIERPEDVLARRKKERDERSRLRNKLGRWWRGEK